MEANLNQFRLLTVEGEQKANDRRGGGGGSGGRKDTPYHRRSNCVGGGSGDVDGLTDAGADLAVDTRKGDGEGGGGERGREGGRLALQRRRRRSSDDLTTISAARWTNNMENEQNNKSDDENYFFNGYNTPATTTDNNNSNNNNNKITTTTTTNPEKTLVEALVSLEHTINQHCQLLNKKLRREKATFKSTLSETARTPVVTVAPKVAVRTDKVIVYIRVVFLKIGEIDTLKENFMADAFIQARWREPALDGKAAQFQSVQNIEDMDWERFWNPKLYVENNLGEPKETIWQTLTFNAKGDATVYERRRIKGCFLENLELDEFPFDTQDLTLTISTERSETELELEEDSSEISSINVQSFVDEQEWKLHSHVETWKRITTKTYQNSKFKHPAFSTSCRASRRPGFYIWNIFLVMLFICSLTFSTFSVELTKPENRLQLSFILLLTTITFKFVVSQTLPRISYLTYLDKYILTSMGILCGVCVWHAIMPLLKYDLEMAKTVDRWGLIVCGSSYFLFHVCFFLYIYFVALKKRWKYDQKDKDHKERVKKLQRLQELSHTTSSPAAPVDAKMPQEV